jgi:uncharacterized protein YggT (Ycf19 family)
MLPTNEKRMAYITTAPRVRPLYRATQVVWYILYVFEALLAFRFVLRLLGANGAATFTQIIYALTAPLAEPFRAVFGVSRVAGATFEWTTLLAMFVYWLLAWGIVSLFAMSRPVSQIDASEKLARQDVVE